MLRPKANFGFTALGDPSLTSIVDPDKIIQLAQRNFANGQNRTAIKKGMDQ
jgi:hypothetical protein